MPIPNVPAAPPEPPEPLEPLEPAAELPPTEASPWFPPEFPPKPKDPAPPPFVLPAPLPAGNVELPFEELQPKRPRPIARELIVTTLERFMSGSSLQK
jgi:hypothetical protein